VSFKGKQVKTSAICGPPRRGRQKRKEPMKPKQFGKDLPPSECMFHVSLLITYPVVTMSPPHEKCQARNICQNEIPRLYSIRVHYSVNLLLKSIQLKVEDVKKSCMFMVLPTTPQEIFSFLFISHLSSHLRTMEFATK
jgi:hypothetical protein